MRSSHSHITLLIILLSLGMTSCRDWHAADIVSGTSPLPTDDFFLTEEDAKEIADQYFKGKKWTLVGTDQDQPLRSASSSEVPSYYLFTGHDGGFVIVSASKAAYPILGYSLESRMEVNNLPCGLKCILEDYCRSINRSRELGLEPTAKMKNLRADAPEADVIVAPLLGEIKWNQSPYYNALAPDAANGVPIGCVATATAQIMRYWEYPERSVGYHSYYHSKFGWLSHDYNYDLHWERMPKETLDKPNPDVARFNYGVAVAINMEFGYHESGAYGNDVPTALIRYYRFPKAVQYINRYNYDYQEWILMMRDELDQNHPLYYDGDGSGGGHAFVCDGYDSGDMFHINWGWGGNSDGWFRIDALDPTSLGTGGGSGGYNQDQGMVVHLAPPSSITGDNNEPIPGENNDPDIEYPTNGTEYTPSSVLFKSIVWIRHTQFCDERTTSGADGYTLYTKKRISAKRGGSLPYKIEIEQTSPLKYQLGLFIDFDDKGSFDPLSNLILNNKCAGEISIPTDVKTGAHRMRVILSPEVSGKDNPSSPNERDYTWGEIEDYFIVIE